MQAKSQNFIPASSLFGESLGLNLVLTQSGAAFGAVYIFLCIAFITTLLNSDNAYLVVTFKKLILFFRYLLGYVPDICCGRNQSAIVYLSLKFGI